jgi:hypothetical protein
MIMKMRSRIAAVLMIVVAALVMNGDFGGVFARDRGNVGSALSINPVTSQALVSVQ